MRPELAGSRRILAVRLDNIGDVVLAGPAIRALARALPEAEITLLASRAGAQVAPMLPWLSDVIVRRPVWQDVSGAVPFDPDREIAFAAELRDRRFDAAFVFTSFRQSADVPGYVTYLGGVPVRVGHAPLFSGGVFSHPVAPPPDETHQVDRSLALVEALGVAVEARDRAVELRVPAAAASAAAARLDEVGIGPDRRFAVVAPGASVAARRYPPERFGAVAAMLAERTGLPVLVVGHAREAELADAVMAAAGERRRDTPIVSLAGRTELLELAAILRRAALLVTNDSGPMHIADAFATPQVVLFAGTDLESQWRPRRSPLALLRRRTACAPCYRFDCPYDLACLDIPPAEVVDEALALLAAGRSDPTEPPATTSSTTA